MADKKVPVLDPDGQFGFIDEGDVEKLPAGARVLTKKQVDDLQAEQTQAAAEAREQERYDKLPTAAKVAGNIQAVTNAITPGGALGTAVSGLGLSPGAAPSIDAYQQGVTSGLSGGLAHGVTRQAVDAISGKEAGDAYAQRVEDSKTANPYSHGIGNLVGTGAGLVAGAGAAAENLAAKGLARAGVQATTTLGKAGVTAAKLGVRGAVEGGIIGAGDYAGEQLLQDHDVAADKLFSSLGTGALYGGATGFALGGGMSLAGSGIKAGLSRALSRETSDVAAREGAELGAQEAPKVGQSLFDNPTAAGKKLANDLAFDSLGATKVQMRKALERVASDQASAKAAVGDYVNRVLKEHVGDNANAWQVGKVGRADDLLKVIQADKAGRIAQGFEDTIRGTTGRVDMSSLAAKADEIGLAMLKDPTKAAGYDAFRNRVLPELDAIARSGKIAADGTVDAAEAFRLRSQLAKQAYEVRQINGAAGDAYKDFLRHWDNVSIEAIDKAASDAGKSGVGDQIRHWKREWQLASAAEKAATGGAERYAGNNTIGLREGIAMLTGIATGHAIPAIATGLGFKLVKERGKAVIAQTLYQAAERGTLAKLVGKVDGQISRASKGLIAAPEKGAAKASEVMPPPRQLVPKTLARVAAFQADPDAFVDHASRQVESIATHSPEIADGIVTRQVRAMSLLSSKLPQQGEPDPLDPHKRVEMTPSEEASFARYAWYAEKPERFFAEVSRGKLTPEGAETAQALMPRAFEQLQQETFEALTTQLARGNKLPFRQRELLGQLLDFAATPAQRPEHRTFLQQNVSDVLPSNEPPLSAAPAKSRRATTPPSGSDALDRLEAKGPGRR